MASTRKAKKLGIYKAPKYTKDRAKLMADTRKLVDQANRRLKGLNQAGYKGTWASKKLAERLDTKVLKAWAKQGKIKLNKNLTNTRASGTDEALTLIAPKKFTLEEALEFIEDDEYVELTPDAIRLRKKVLDPKERFRIAGKNM